MAKQQQIDNPRILKLIELESEGRIKPEHQQELDTYRAQGLAPKRVGLTESEAKTTNFYNRAIGANQDYAAAGGTDAQGNPVDIGPVGLAGDAARAILPTGVVNSFASDARQKSEQAKRDFIAASLRYESGAAISPQEFTKQDQIFFPQAGDGPDVIKQKAAARQRVIDSFKVSSGAGADRVDQIQSQERGNIVFGNEGPAEVANAVHLTPDQEARFKQIAQTGDMNALASYASSLNLKIPQDQLDAGAKFYGDPTHRNVQPSVTVDNSVKAVQRPEEVSQADQRVGAFGRGVANTVSLGLTDRIAALADTATKGGTYADNLNTRRGYDAYDEQNHGGFRLGGEIAGGFLLPAPGGFVPSVGEATAANLAAHGAAYGAASGFNNSYGDGLSRLASAGGGALAGGALGYGAGRLSEALAARAGSPPTPGGGGINSDVVNAAERQGVQIVRPDADPSRRSLYGFLESLPFSGGRVRADLQRGADQIEQRVADIGGGQDVGRSGMGEAIQAGLQNRDDRMHSIVSRAYTRFENAAGDSKIEGRSALDNINGQLADLSETANTSAPVISALNSLKSDLTDEAGNVKPVSAAAFKRLQTNVREQAQTDGLRSTDYERRANLVLDSLKQDAAEQLPPAANRTLARASRLHAERVGFLDDISKRFLGGTDTRAMSAEQTAQKVSTMASPKGGDAARLAQMVSALEPQERSQVAGTIAAELGRRGTDGDNAFSPNLFFSQIQNYSPEARAAIWGEQGAKDLADLATIAEGRAGTMGRLNNTRSGQVSNWLGAIKSIVGGNAVGGAAGLALGGVGGAATGAAGGAALVPAGLTGAYLSARSLGNPRVVSILAQAGRANTPAAQVRIVQNLSRLAVRNPEIANDILPIRKALEAALPGVAAEDQKQNGR